MGFKEIYAKVDELKETSIYDMLRKFRIELLFSEFIPLNRDAIIIEKTLIIKNILDENHQNIVILHEIGHFLFDRGGHCCNHRTEENNANLFMCLYLVNNEIWCNSYFDEFLIYSGVDPKVARQFNEYVWQYKRQQVLQLAY